MGAYGFPDTALLGLVQSNHEEVESIPAGTATIKPGDLVFTYQGENLAYPYFADVTKLVFSGDIGASNSTVVTVNGVAAPAVVYGTSHLATITAIVAGLQGLAVTGTTVKAVLDSSDSNNRTILVLTKGATSVASAVVTGGSAVTVAATTGTTASSSPRSASSSTSAMTTLPPASVSMRAVAAPRPDAPPVTMNTLF